MEFRLLFEGRLMSNGSATEKHGIRRTIHPQLRQLWSSDRNLRQLAVHKGNDGTPVNSDDERFAKGIAAIGKSWKRAGYNLVPIVTREMDLSCRIQIVLLRRENSRGIIKNGDIDNKLKTLFDALRLPESESETGRCTPSSNEDPLFVLLEDDQLITEVEVVTDRLLMLPSRPEIRADDAFAMIHVQLKHRNARTFDNYFG